MALTSLTAIWALEDTAKLQRGETILIQGGAGGVAGFAIQLAKHIGATVHHDRERGTTTITCAASAPTGSSITMPRTSRRALPAATWCSTRSAAMFRPAPTPC